MEYVDGMTVADHIRLSGPMPEPLALVVTKGVAEALESALEERIIHRDVKPANIMLTKTRRVKLADLGLAKALGSTERLSETGVNATLGTPYYFSPEQARDAASVDHRADIYSLGCTLYHMLTGHVPYQGNGLTDVIRQHEAAPIPDARAERPEISQRATDLARWMMAKEVAQRPPDYAAVINAIQRCIVDPEPDEMQAASAGSPRSTGILRRFLTNVLGEEKPTRA
jgi:serine/threonine protein kinase